MFSTTSRQNRQQIEVSPSSQTPSHCYFVSHSAQIKKKSEASEHYEHEISVTLNHLFCKVVVSCVINWFLSQSHWIISLRRVQRSKNNYIDINFASEVQPNQQQPCIHNSLTRQWWCLGVCMFLTVNNTFWQVLQMFAYTFFFLLHHSPSSPKRRWEICLKNGRERVTAMTCLLIIMLQQW